MASLTPPPAPQHVVDAEQSVDPFWHEWFTRLRQFVVDLSARVDALVIPSSADIVAVGMVPFYIAPAETFLVPAYKQALFANVIDNQGMLVVDGFLIQVT